MGRGHRSSFDAVVMLARVQLQALLREPSRRWTLIVCGALPLLAFVFPLLGVLGAGGFAPEHVAYGEMTGRGQRVTLAIPVFVVFVVLSVPSYQLALWIADQRRSGMLAVLRRTPLRLRELWLSGIPLGLGLAMWSGALLSGLAAMYAGVAAAQTWVTLVSLLVGVLFAGAFAFLLGARLRTETGIIEAVFVLVYIGAYAAASLIPLEGPWALLGLVNPASWHVVPLATGMLGAQSSIPIAVFWALSVLGSAACVYFGSRYFRWELPAAK